LKWTLLPESKYKAKAGSNEEDEQRRNVQKGLKTANRQRPELANKLGAGHEI
jgi:hypothetical protein